MKFLIYFFLVLYGLFFSQYSASITKIENPDWRLTDSFEGERDSEFWSAEGISVKYGVKSDPFDENNKVMEMIYVPNSEGNGDSWSEYDFRIPVNAVQVEISFRMFIPENYKHIENNHKLFALWSGPYGKAVANVSVSSEQWGRSGGTAPSVYVGEDGNNYGHSMLSPSVLFLEDSANKWIDVHIFLELASEEGSYGRLELSKNGKFITGTHHPNLTKAYSVAPIGPELIKYSSRGNFINQGTLLGWANGAPEGGFLVDTVFLIDNFEIKTNLSFGTVIRDKIPKKIESLNVQ